MVEGQSWQSMKERFRRSIVKRLDLFGLDDQQEEQLRQGGRRGKNQTVKHDRYKYTYIPNKMYNATSSN